LTRDERNAAEGRHAAPDENEVEIVLPASWVDELLKAALREDLGSGDVTTEALIPAHLRGRAEILAKEVLVVAGQGPACRVFHLLDDSVSCRFEVADGGTVQPGGMLARVEGPLRALLSGERLALNLLQHLSGVASLTRRFVEAVAGTGVRILDTRKTLPGLRALEKAAVRLGGGVNHRSSLSEGVLIKENHILACGGIREAVARMRAGCPPLLEIEVETTNRREVEEALAAGVRRILLDNMGVEEIREIVGLVRGRAVLEASGGVNLENVRRIAETGVADISVGRIIHSAPGVDISMLVRDVREPSGK